MLKASFRGSRFLVVSLVGLSLFLLVAVVVFLVVFGARALSCSVTCGHSQRKRMDSLGRDSVWSTDTNIAWSIIFVGSSSVMSAASTCTSWLALSSCSTLSGVVTFGLRETVAVSVLIALVNSLTVDSTPRQWLTIVDFCLVVFVDASRGGLARGQAEHWGYFRGEVIAVMFLFLIPWPMCSSEVLCAFHGVPRG